MRESHVEDATRALGAAVSDERRAAEATRAAEAAKARIEADVEATKRAEQAKVEAGELRAADLAQAASWAVGAKARQAAARDVVAKRRSEEQSATKRVDEARGVVATRRADADVVASMLAKARAEEVRREAAALDEAAEETVAARRGKR